MQFQPEYLSFIKRVWLQVYKTILLFLMTIFIGALIGEVSLIHAVLIGVLPVCVVLLLGSFIVNRICLKSIAVEEEFI